MEVPIQGEDNLLMKKSTTSLISLDFFALPTAGLP